MRYFLLILLSMFFLDVKAQNESKRINLGTFPINGGYSLEAIKEGQKYIYSLIDTNQQGKRVISFSPYINSSENFITGFLENVKGINFNNNEAFQSDNNGLEEKLNSFFEIIQISAAAILENENGPEVMTMYLNPDVELTRSPNRENQPVLKKDVIKLYNISFDAIVPSHTSKNKIFQEDSFHFIESTKRKTIDSKKITKSEKYLELYNLIVKSREISSKEFINATINENSDSITKVETLKLELSESEKVLSDIYLDKNQNERMDSTSRKIIESDSIKISLSIEAIGKKIVELNRYITSEEINNLNQKINTLNYLLYKNNLSLIEIEWKIDEVKLDTLGNKVYPPSQNGLEDLEIAPEDKKDKNLQKIDKELESIEDNISEIADEKKKIKTYENELSEIISKIDSLTKAQITIKNEIKIKDNVITKKLESTIKSMWKESGRRMSVESVQMEINSGFIENLVVSGISYLEIDSKQLDYIKEIDLINGNRIKLINDYPLGISSKLDIERLKNIQLHSRFENENHFELRLGDLISNIEEILALDRRDYSPKDDAYYIQVSQSGANQRFYKNPTKEILEARIYTDALGLDENNPNGLIQVEIAKEIPLVTKRYQKAQIMGLTRWLINRNANIGFLNYLRPDFVFSKIEDNNRYLLIDQYPDENSSTYVTSAFNLKQYESFSVGVDLNLVFYDLPYAKSTFLINGGFRFGRTNLTSNAVDPNLSTLPRNFTNTLQPSADFIWKVNGDERFGLETSYSLLWVYSDELFFEQRSALNKIQDGQDLNASDKSALLNRITIQAYLNLNKDRESRVFMRYRANSEVGAWKLNFTQLQFGITTLILAKK